MPPPGQAPAAPSFPFLRLPFDVQYRVLLYAVTFPQAVWVDQKLPAIPLVARPPGTALALCFTCRQLFALRGYYYERNEFVLGNAGSVVRFRRDIGPQLAARIRHVRLELRRARTDAHRFTWQLGDGPAAPASEPTLWQLCAQLDRRARVRLVVVGVRYLSARLSPASLAAELALLESSFLHVLDDTRWLRGRRCRVETFWTEPAVSGGDPEVPMWGAVKAVIGPVVPAVNRCLDAASWGDAADETLAARDLIARQFGKGRGRRP